MKYMFCVVQNKNLKSIFGGRIYSFWVLKIMY